MTGSQVVVVLLVAAGLLALSLGVDLMNLLRVWQGRPSVELGDAVAAEMCALVAELELTRIATLLRRAVAEVRRLRGRET